MSPAETLQTGTTLARLTRDLTAGKLASHTWPVPFGASVAFMVTEATQWTHPAVIAVLTGALVQVLIALMRSWFTERRELLTTLREMLAEQRKYVHNMLLEEQSDRHALANRASQAEMKLHLLASGVRWEDLPSMPALYQRVEDQSSADHESRSEHPATAEKPVKP